MRQHAARREGVEGGRRSGGTARAGHGKAEPITLCELIIGTIAVETKVSLKTVTTQAVLKGNI